MSERHLKGPDESFEAISKDNTRETQSGHEKNKPKPEDVRLKDEITPESDDESSEDEEA